MTLLYVGKMLTFVQLSGVRSLCKCTRTHAHTHTRTHTALIIINVVFQTVQCLPLTRLCPQLYQVLATPPPPQCHFMASYTLHSNRHHPLCYHLGTFFYPVIISRTFRKLMPPRSLISYHVRRGFAKLKFFPKIQNKLGQSSPHPPTPIQTLFWKPITDMDRRLKS